MKTFIYWTSRKRFAKDKHSDPGKLTAPLSAFRNVLSVVSMVPAGWEVAESQRKAESTLMLAESGAVILSRPQTLYLIFIICQRKSVYYYDYVKRYVTYGGTLQLIF